MNELHKVAQQALEALSLALSDVDWRKDSPTQPVIHKAYNALREALSSSEDSSALTNTDVPPGYVLVPVDALERWRAAFDEELSAWDIDPPKWHQAHTSNAEIAALLAAAQSTSDSDSLAQPEE